MKRLVFVTLVAVALVAVVAGVALAAPVPPTGGTLRCAHVRAISR